MGLPGLAGVASPERITQEVEAFLRYTADAGLVFVDLQLQFLDHLPHRLHGEIGRIPAADHQVVSVVNDDDLSRFSVPDNFHHNTSRRMYRFDSSGEIGEPCGGLRCRSRLRLVRRLRPRSSVSSTGASIHALKVASFT